MEFSARIAGEKRAKLAEAGIIKLLSAENMFAERVKPAEIAD